MHDVNSIYQTLEDEIVPLFYDRDRDNIPRGWVEIMRETIRSNAAKFSMRRMVKEYTDEMYALLTYEYFDVDLQDGNTAFQAYQLHEMASGQHEKNKLSLRIKYFLAGMEFGFIYQYLDGSFDPDFGGGFVPVGATEDVRNNFGYAIDSPGFFGRFGGWNSLTTRDFEHQRIKAFMKVAF